MGNRELLRVGPLIQLRRFSQPIRIAVDDLRWRKRRFQIGQPRKQRPSGYGRWRHWTVRFPVFVFFNGRYSRKKLGLNLVVSCGKFTNSSQGVCFYPAFFFLWSQGRGPTVSEIASVAGVYRPQFLRKFCTADFYYLRWRWWCRFTGRSQQVRFCLPCTILI